MKTINIPGNHETIDVNYDRVLDNTRLGGVSHKGKWYRLWVVNGRPILVKETLWFRFKMWVRRLLTKKRYVSSTQ